RGTRPQGATEKTQRHRFGQRRRLLRRVEQLRTPFREYRRDLILNLFVYEFVEARREFAQHRFQTPFQAVLRMDLQFPWQRRRLAWGKGCDKWHEETIRNARRQ